MQRPGLHTAVIPYTKLKSALVEESEEFVFNDRRAEVSAKLVLDAGLFVTGRAYDELILMRS